jgi:putative SOS response-associated peptidase YedK
VCARYEVADAPSKIAEELEASIEGEIPARATIAPTDTAPALIEIEGTRVLVPMKFGWPSTRPKERIHLNTRSETAARGDSAEALSQRRCLLPAHAFHEWSGPKGARLHHLFASEASPLITMAGLYLREGDGPARFVILTTAASREVRPFHHRMPLVVPADQRTAWIHVDDGDAEDLLARVRRAEPLRMIDRGGR